MHDDATLLRSYVDEHSEEAFAELVQRHLPLVYSVTLRRLGGDAHLAKDVAQKVFVDLAKHAASLRGHASLSGWLYVSAQLASADLVRREQRRKQRETTAYAMHIENSGPDVGNDLANLRPMLDDAIVVLKRDERDAIVLRFFEKRTFAEIGATLRVNEDAARKRVDRALDKLQAILKRRGISSTAVALGVALTATATSNVPLGLAAQISNVALAQSAAATTSMLATFTAAAVPTAAVVAAFGWLILPQQRANNAIAAEIAQLSAQVQSLPAVRAENDQLARSVAADRAHRAERSAADRGATVTAAAPVPHRRATP